MRDVYLRGALSTRATQRQMDVLAAFVAASGSVQDTADLVAVSTTIWRKCFARNGGSVADDLILSTVRVGHPVARNRR
jgi:hypothetical protein